MHVILMKHLPFTGVAATLSPEGIMRRIMDSEVCQA